MTNIRDLRPVAPILIGAAMMLSLSMGLRQSFGLIMQPLTRDLAINVSDFALAMAMQSLGWGLLQPVAGALVVRLGFRRVMFTGLTLYLAGLVVLATAQGFFGVILGAGVLIGSALACTDAGMALAVGARTAPAKMRSMIPSGDQVLLRHGDHRAVVVEVGGGLRSYALGDWEVLDGYAESEQCSGGRGQALLPWPNRVRDGRYAFGGAEHQLALTEPERHNALHGLVRWVSWTVR